VVSLIKWKGFFFPYPTFGGVMVVDPGAHDTSDYIERILIGKGTYIAPDETKNYPFLTRQNTLAEQVSRLQAQSLQFLGGFTDPLPWNKETAVKIPDLEDDQNQQPFVTDFNFSCITGLVWNLLEKSVQVYLLAFLFPQMVPISYTTIITELKKKVWQEYLPCP